MLRASRGAAERRAGTAVSRLFRDRPRGAPGRKGMKVLIADDEPISRRLLQSFLEKWGYRVAVAADGAEAWELFQREPFPLVVSDWMMPGVDGLELIRRIRSFPRPGYVFTILLTARS